MKWIKILLIAFVIVLVIRSFAFESYRMPSTQMENSVIQGDFILVDKTAFGIRTPSSIPQFDFIPDSVYLFNKAYPTFIKLPSFNYLEAPLNRNDIVVYHIPDSLATPVNRLPVSISRCIGLPGDTIEVSGKDYYINGTKIMHSPDAVSSFTYNPGFGSKIDDIMLKLDIPQRNTSSGIKHLSRYERYLIQDALNDTNIFKANEKEILTYKIRIPQRHYWLLSDNAEVSADSRHYGFIPQSHLIGKARLIWMSKELTGNPFTGYHTNRIFTKVNK